MSHNQTRIQKMQYCISPLIMHGHHVSCFSFFFSSRRRHTRLQGDWSSDVCSSDLPRRLRRRPRDRARAVAHPARAAVPAAEHRRVHRVPARALPPAAGAVRAPPQDGVSVPARARGWLAVGAVVAIGLVLSVVVQERYHHRVLTLVFLWATMGLAWNVISGYAGQISFGHQVFFGIGAYVTVLLVLQAGLTPWIGMAVAIAVAVLAAVLIGLPTFRLAGIYFGLATLAYPLIFRIVMEWLGYQEVAIPMKRDHPAWFMQFVEPRSFSVLALAVLGATLVLSR